MSNVKVNGNTYNDVTSVKLMKDDGSGYAEFKENVADTDTLMDTLLADDSVGNIESDTGEVYLGWMQGIEFGTVSFPYATKATGYPHSCTFENLLLPAVTDYSGAVGKGVNGYRMPNSINNCKITGTLDLSKVATSTNNTLGIANCTIGTLKLGSYMPGWGQTTTITNAIIPGFTADYEVIYFKLVNITNLYVPSTVLEHVQSMVTAGTLPNVTNVYSIDGWED